MAEVASAVGLGSIHPSRAFQQRLRAIQSPPSITMHQPCRWLFILCGNNLRTAVGCTSVALVVRLKSSQRGMTVPAVNPALLRLSHYQDGREQAQATKRTTTVCPTLTRLER